MEAELCQPVWARAVLTITRPGFVSPEHEANLFFWV